MKGDENFFKSLCLRFFLSYQKRPWWAILLYIAAHQQGDEIQYEEVQHLDRKKYLDSSMRYLVGKAILKGEDGGPWIVCCSNEWLGKINQVILDEEQREKDMLADIRAQLDKERWGRHQHPKGAKMEPSITPK